MIDVKVSNVNADMPSTRQWLHFFRRKLGQKQARVIGVR